MNDKSAPYFIESPDALLVVDELGTIISVNSSCIALINESKDILLGSQFVSLVKSSNLDFNKQIIDAYKEKNSFTCKVQLANGLKNAQVNASYVSNGTLLCKITLLSQRQLDESGDLILFVEESPRSVAMFDNEMNYVACSDAWEIDWGVAKMGYTKHTIKGENHYELFKDVKDDWKEIHARGLKGELLQNSRDTYINKSGNQVWLNWQVRPWHTKNNAIGGILLFTDIITEQVEVELALRKSEEKLDLFFSQSFDGFFIMEAASPVKWDETVDKTKQIKKIFKELKITKVNKAFVDHYGLTEEQMLGYTYADFFKNEIDRGYSSITEMLDNRQQMIINKDVKSNGQQIWIEGDYLCLFNNDNEITATFGIHRDITQRIIDDEELRELTLNLVRSNNELQQFAYITSHDLRSPVVNLKSLIQFYDRSLINIKNLEIFDKIEISVNQLDDTLAELIDVVAEKNKKVEKSSKINFESKTSAVLVSIEELIKKKNARVTVDFSKVESINYQNAHITSFILNLVTNALKYSSDKRMPQINISTYKSEEYTCLEVSDNGIGIDMNKNGNRVFWLYQKLNNLPNSKGMGLYIVKNQVESLGGRIEVKSELEVGTTFTMYLLEQ